MQYLTCVFTFAKWLNSDVIVLS